MCSVCNLSFHLTIWGQEPLWWRGPWELASTCWSDCLQRETCRSYHGSRVTVIKSWCCTVVLLEESLEVESERAPLIVKDEMQDRHQITATQLHAETWRCRIRFRRTLGNSAFRWDKNWIRLASAMTVTGFVSHYGFFAPKGQEECSSWFPSRNVGISAVER